jgi:hypothetical protein
MFHAEDEECYLCSEFFDLGIKLRIAGNASAPLFNKATQDLWNISTLLARLEWTRTLAHQGALNTGAWSSFSSLDIENFFVQMRSIMDHVAEILQSLLPKGKQLPESFRRLRESLDKYRTRLPSDIAALVAGANWFDEMRSARDALVHQGGYSLVFSEPKDGILFQVYGKGHKGCFSHPAIMFNDNVVRFDRYASHVVSNLLVFLDRLGAALLSKTTAIGSVPGQVRCSSMGFALLRLWISDFLSVLHNAPSDRAPTP